MFERITERTNQQKANESPEGGLTLMQGVSTSYPTNVVACKLWGLVKSPAEHILGLALFNKLADFYDGWECWVYSPSEFEGLTTLAVFPDSPDLKPIAIVPALNIANVGEVDFAVFIPSLSVDRPIVVVECDGHDFHERTVEQASRDRKRDRALLKLDIPVLRFTGTDVVRSSAEVAEEIADFIDYKLPFPF
jgi:Protein of unknown function (DUF559)